MTIRNRMLKTMAPLTGLVVLAAIVAATAAPSSLAASVTTSSAQQITLVAPAATLHITDACPNPGPFAVGYSCEYQKATKTTSSSSHVHIVVKKTVKEQVRQYQKATGKKVAIAVMPKGITSHAGCVNPVTLGQIKPGQAYQDSGSNIGYFWTPWVNGRLACGEHIVVIAGHRYYKARKDNCGNWILIPIGPVAYHVVYPVLEISTTKTWSLTYDKWVNRTASSSVHYSCPNGMGLTYRNGVGWCYRATQVPTPAPTPTPTPPGAKAVCTLDGVPQYVQPVNTVINSQGQCVAQANNCPANQVTDASGNCVNQSNAAQIACSNAGGDWRSSLGQCWLLQVTNNCGNVYIVIDSTTGQQTTQGSNCNNNPPPCTSNCTPAPTPTLIVNNCTQPQEDPVGQIYGLITCHAYGPNGDMLKMSFGAKFGNWTSDPTVTFKSSSADAVTSNGKYVAPTSTDQLPLDSSGKPYDTITVTLTDSSNSAVQPVTATVQVEITAPDVHP